MLFHATTTHTAASGVFCMKSFYSCAFAATYLLCALRQTLFFEDAASSAV